MPFTFRLLFHSLRSLWIAGALAIIAWLVFVPPSEAERAAIGNGPLAASPVAIAQMRVARVIVHVAPKRAAQLLSRASGGEISPEFAGMLLREMARQPTGLAPQTETVSETVRSTRTAGRAKFVTVD
ncbi:MAG: hypothetical protein AAFQ09_05295 [Pseudomonadota bacterium]